mmetsp:Transcript_42017/g.30822  ORF Transcript_42017/g.30822 Transcript_42017/m.30822 type:complete len:89 (+) Transcript_42017:245-511(+)
MQSFWINLDKKDSDKLEPGYQRPKSESTHNPEFYWSPKKVTNPQKNLNESQKKIKDDIFNYTPILKKQEHKQSNFTDKVNKTRVESQK